MSRVLVGVVLVAALIAGGLYWKRDDVALAIFRQGAERAIAMDTAATLPDGLAAGFCGTGSPLPDRTRAGACLLVVAGRHIFVFDAGDGAAETITQMGFKPTNIEAVFLTHFHSDHIDGLGALALQHWVQHAATAPLPVYGGEGVERVVGGFNEAYAIDSTYRTAHHGAAVAPPSGFGLSARPFAIADGQQSTVVYDNDGVKVIAFTVDHGPVHPAFGYRIDYAGRSITISGDTAPTPNVAAMAQNTDLLVHEALSPTLVNIIADDAAADGQAGLSKIMHDIQNYHTTPSQAADAATAAHAHALALTHIVPPLPYRILEGPFLGDARAHFSGPFWVMQDGDLVSLPRAGGISKTHVLR
ncbi:MAG TPA: MBL fold metallo-hydrolase [Vitreimonas sp.]|jgi:ribonuclease Z|nr:MBL fold metallo-hydrolase [Vitreimonas sp.]